MDFSDQATTIREGEELDVSRVEAFLKQAIPGLTGSLTIRQFPAGFSNLTYLLRFRQPRTGAAPAPFRDQGQNSP